MYLIIKLDCVKVVLLLKMVHRSNSQIMSLLRARHAKEVRQVRHAKQVKDTRGVGVTRGGSLVSQQLGRQLPCQFHIMQHPLPLKKARRQLLHTPGAT